MRKAILIHTVLIFPSHAVTSQKNAEANMPGYFADPTIKKVGDILKHLT